MLGSGAELIITVANRTKQLVAMVEKDSNHLKKRLYDCLSFSESVALPPHQSFTPHILSNKI